MTPPGETSLRGTPSAVGATLRSRPEAVIAVVFALLAILLALSSRLVDDEGYLAYIGAVLVRRIPVDALFFQKVHPSASVLYAPVVAWGWQAFLVWHALLAAAAVWMTGAVARKAGGAGWLAALVVATSPLYFTGAATGLSNNTGLFLLVASFWLYLQGGHRASFAAGFVTALALWSRYEQAPYLLGLLLYAFAVRRDWRFVLAFAAAVLAYVGMGALYHGSPLWLFDKPPALVRETGPSTLGAMGLGTDNVRALLVRFLLLTPLYLVPTLLPSWRSMPRPLRWLAVMLPLAWLTQFVLPLLGGLFNYDHTARYFLVHLPAIAVLAACALPGLSESNRSSERHLVLGMCGLIVGVYAGPHLDTLVGLVAFAIPLLLDGRSRKVTTGIVIGAVIFQAVPAALYLERETYSFPDPALVEAAHSLKADPQARVIYTNIHQLDGLMGDAATAEVRFLPGYDIVIELASLLGGNEQQAQAVLTTVKPVLYGTAVWPCEFPRSIEAGSLLLLSGNTRTDSVFDLATWKRQSELVARFDNYELWRAPEAFTVPPAPRPPWLSREEFCLPCPQTCLQP